jgi:hypothetical protein
MKQCTVLAACVLTTLFLPAQAMVHAANPLHAISTLIFKQMHQESISTKDIHEAHTQFKMYRATRNVRPLDRQNNSYNNSVQK